jgi:ribosome-binding factor A
LSKPAKAGSSKADSGKAGSFKANPGKSGSGKTGKAVSGKAGPTQRQLRVAEEIRHVLSGVFTRNEFRDPDLATAQITVTEVRIGPDLKRATAFISRLGRSDVDALIPSLERATPYLRGQVAKALRLRIAPDLTFTPDLALDYAMKIDELMHRPEIARDLQHELLPKDDPPKH